MKGASSMKGHRAAMKLPLTVSGNDIKTLCPAPGFLQASRASTLPLRLLLTTNLSPLGLVPSYDQSSLSS